ncbi:MAG: hypothetical protein LAN83_03955 [Acidobacteriia bacterium]|nr:hypothetical protein [Terriglobia bacterium]
MKTVSIEEQIASVSAKCSEIDARRKEVERQAEQAEKRRRELLVKAVGEDDAGAQAEVERLAGEANAARQLAADLGFALTGLEARLSGLRERQTKEQKVARIRNAQKLCARRAALGKEISAKAAAFVRSVQEADQASIDLCAVLRALESTFPDYSRLSRSAMSHALKALGQKASDGFRLDGMIQHDVNFLGWAEWDSKLFDAVAAKIKKCLLEESPASEAEPATAA